MGMLEAKRALPCFELQQGLAVLDAPVFYREKQSNWCHTAGAQEPLTGLEERERQFGITSSICTGTC